MNDASHDPTQAQRLEYIKDLKNEVDTIKSILKRESDREKRPLIIEFCGSPRSGKTSCLSSLEIFLKRNDFSVKIVHEKAASCPIKDKSNPAYNTWNTLQLLCDVYETTCNGEDVDFILLDRGLFDSLFWSKWHHDEHRLSHDELNKFDEFVLSTDWRKYVQIVFIFTCDNEVSVQREHANLLTDEQGAILNSKNLERYSTAIEHVKGKFSEQFKSIETIDTSKITQNTVGHRVTKRILGVLKRILDEHVAVVPRASLSASLQNSPTPFDEFFSGAIGDQVEFIPRAEVELRDDVVQIVPTLFVKDLDSEDFFSATKQDRKAAAVEKGRIVFQFGGHARDTDAHSHSHIDLFKLSKSALAREINEELGIAYKSEATDALCIWSSDSPKSLQHIAVCFLTEVDAARFAPKIGSEFVSRGNRKPRFRKINDIDPTTLDRWSLLYLNHKYPEKNLGHKILDDNQSSLAL